jgi:hypothetical protein
MKIAVLLTHERTTKNTERYREEPDNPDSPVVGTLYIRKSHLPDTPPAELTLTIEDRNA